MQQVDVLINSMSHMSKGPSAPPAINNKKALHNFEIIETVEAGIALTGSEVKSLRAGRASLDEAFGHLRKGELFLRDCNISPYANAGYAQHVPTRERKLLLHKRELRKWEKKVTERGLTLVPLKLYFNERGLVKVSIALARGKKSHDKRQDLKKRADQREMDRSLKEHRR